MNKKGRLFIKALLAVLGLAVITYILIVSVQKNRMKQPEGERLRLQDALILTQALDPEAADSEAYRLFSDRLSRDPELLTTYEQFLSLLQVMAAKPGKAAFTLSAGSVDPAFDSEEIVSLCEKEYGKKYRKEFFFLEADFYRIYDQLLICYDRTSVITRADVTVLGVGAEVKDQENVELPKDRLLTQEGIRPFLSDRFGREKYQLLSVYRKEDTLLTVREIKDRGYGLHNIWIMEAEEGKLRIFKDGYELLLPWASAKAEQREQIADFTFADGALRSVKVKSQKVNGKLLSVRDGEVELLGQGKFLCSEDLKIYRLYGELTQCGIEELRIGYDFTDFVLEDGKICAGLITRDEAMENIRVVIKNTGFAGAYHEQVTLTSDSDYTLTYGSYDQPVTEQHKAGEEITLTSDSMYFSGDRVYLEPAVRTGRMQLLSLERAQGTPSYRGKIEVARTPEGLVAVNEVLLEEYLYSVVPSEMPASYPLEALKAQAVCARTYAYRHMLHSGIAGFGAHVDDSAGFQVYNNIAENAQSTRAVKETSGQLLYYGEELCGAYYYSTSCGFGTDIHIWKGENTEETPYLQARRIGTDTSVFTGENMTEKGTFESFIAENRPQDYESGQAWYRWTYAVDALDPERLLAALKARYEVNERLVLTKDKEGNFVSRPIKRLGQVKDLSIVKRNAGGVADELEVQGTLGTYRVLSEHNIRYVLCNGESQVVRQDGSRIDTPSLLPSAYIAITTGKEDGFVVAYTLIGGGYGHGVGMSQNGAMAMAKSGLKAQDILTFFYQNCEVKDIY